MPYLITPRADYTKGRGRFIAGNLAAGKSRLATVLNDLSYGREPTANFNPHPLKGKMQGTSECHVVGTKWILVYEFDHLSQELILHCLGSHEDCLCK